MSVILLLPSNLLLTFCFEIDNTAVKIIVNNTSLNHIKCITARPRRINKWTLQLFLDGHGWGLFILLL